jgi:hypothetical protein
VCSHCDRGQRYCAADCAVIARKALQQEAAQRYQCSRSGRLKHAQRTRRWRERQATLNQSVTHQVRISAIVDGCFKLIVDDVSAPSWTRRDARKRGINVSQTSHLLLAGGRREARSF